ncbi:MAG: Uma2 family endonuclease [Pseudomonadota bacterium]
MNIQTPIDPAPPTEGGASRYRLDFDDYKFLWDACLHRVYGKTELLDGIIYGRPMTPADAETRRHRITLPEYLLLWNGRLHAKPFKTELINGTIYQMPADGPLTSRWNGAINRWLQLSVTEDRVVKAEQTLFLGNEWAPDPDHYVFPADLDEEDVTGADIALLIEVSVSTLSFDLTEKAAGYASSGIREYWVIDPNSKTLYAHRLGDDGTYGEPLEIGFTDTVTAQHIPGLRLRMAELPRIS